MAERNDSSETNSVYTDHYGIVDAIYLKESRIVISDMNYQYKKRSSSFFNIDGKRFSKLKKVLTIGTPVKFHYNDNRAPVLMIKDLTVIPMREYEKSLPEG